MQNGKDLANLYRIRFQTEFLPRKIDIWKILCKNFFQQFVTKGDTVVDVACGYGEFINNIEADKKIGIDLNTETKSHLNSDIEFHAISAANLSNIGEAIEKISDLWTFKANNFDLKKIYLLNLEYYQLQLKYAR